MPLRFLLALALTAAPVMCADAQACRSDDVTARYLVADLKRLVATTDQRVQAARDSFYHIPVVPATTIGLVFADSVCTAAVQALNTLYGESKPRRVYVATIGSGWAVIDPEDNPPGRFTTVVIFDSEWRDVGGCTRP